MAASQQLLESLKSIVNGAMKIFIDLIDVNSHALFSTHLEMTALINPRFMRPINTLDLDIDKLYFTVFILYFTAKFTNHFFNYL